MLLDFEYQHASKWGRSFMAFWLNLWIQLVVRTARVFRIGPTDRVFHKKIKQIKQKKNTSEGS